MNLCVSLVFSRFEVLTFQYYLCIHSIHLMNSNVCFWQMLVLFVTHLFSLKGKMSPTDHAYCPPCTEANCKLHASNDNKINSCALKFGTVISQKLQVVRVSLSLAAYNSQPVLENAYCNRIKFTYLSNK